MIAGIETGGTKCFCAVAQSNDPTQIIDSVRIPTRDPDSTLGDIYEFLARNHQHESIEAIGVASFGPLDTSANSATFGTITCTPKPGWTNTDLTTMIGGLKTFRRSANTTGPIPMNFVTDVSGSLLGETAFGATQGMANAAYVTVGTGIGVGLMVEGRLVTGHGTPELGHIVVRRHPEDHFKGNCPYHGDCLEGLASGPAIAERRMGLVTEVEELVVGYYIAQLLVTITLATAPERIVIGGGVMKTPRLLDAVRKDYRTLIAGYLGEDHPSFRAPEEFVVIPELGDDAGVIGALVLAQDMLPLRGVAALS